MLTIVRGQVQQKSTLHPARDDCDATITTSMTRLCTRNGRRGRSRCRQKAASSWQRQHLSPHSNVISNNAKEDQQSQRHTSNSNDTPGIRTIVTHTIFRIYTFPIVSSLQVLNEAAYDTV